jgi:hypothetical protein
MRDDAPRWASFSSAFSDRPKPGEHVDVEILAGRNPPHSPFLEYHGRGGRLITSIYF